MPGRRQSRADLDAGGRKNALTPGLAFTVTAMTDKTAKQLEFATSMIATGHPFIALTRRLLVAKQRGPE